MKEVKGVCFDLDQTLSNTEDFYYKEGKDRTKTAEWQVYQYLKPHLKIVDWKTFMEVYEESKVLIKKQIPNSAASHSRYLYFQKLLEILGLDFSPNLVYEVTNIYWNYIIDRTKLFPGVLDVLKKLRRNHIKIAIVTDLTADFQNLKLKRLGIDGYVNFLITSEEAGVDKPDPKMIEIALDKMNLSKEHVLVVGNNPKTDIQVSKNIGVKSVLFDYHSKYPKEQRNDPDYYVTDMSKILDIIDIKSQSYSDERLVVFDVMGTLTKEEHLISVILNRFIPEMNYNKVKGEYEKFKINKISRKQFWTNIRVDDYEGLEKDFLEAILLKEGAKRVLSSLKRKNKLAILSNTPKEWGKYLVDKYCLEEYFDEIVFSGEIGVKKPDPLIYRNLLERFPEIRPENTYFVDNDLGDLRSGKNYLMKTVWLESEKKDLRYVPDYVVENIMDVVKLMKGR